jgi:hypothetical protein
MGGCGSAGKDLKTVPQNLSICVVIPYLFRLGWKLFPTNNLKQRATKFKYDVVALEYLNNVKTCVATWRCLQNVLVAG